MINPNIKMKNKIIKTITGYRIEQFNGDIYLTDEIAKVRELTQ